MFSYIDGTIGELLLDSGRLVHLDETGQALTHGDQEGKPYLSMVGPVPLPLDLDGAETEFAWYAFVRRSELKHIEELAQRVRADSLRELWPLVSSYMAVNSLLVYGDFSNASKPLVRVHSSCMTSDVWGSLRCECGPQMRQSMHRIVEEGVGAVVYMTSHEGRGIGLWAKAVTYILQDMGQDTYQANVSLGLPEDSRDFVDAGVVLKAMRPKGDGIRLLSNNLLKKADLEKAGVRVARMEPIVCGVTPYNRRYLKSKQSKGHQIPESLLETDPK